MVLRVLSVSSRKEKGGCLITWVEYDSIRFFEVNAGALLSGALHILPTVGRRERLKRKSPASYLNVPETEQT